MAKLIVRFLVFCLLCGIGCALATVNSPVNCDTQTITWKIPNLAALGVPIEIVELLDSSVPNVSFAASFDLPPLSTDVEFDFSRVVAKISDVADNLQVSISELEVYNVGNSLDWASDIDVTMRGKTTDTPEVKLGHTSFSSHEPGEPLGVNVTMSPNDIEHYLASGPVTLRVTLTASTPTLTELKQIVAIGRTLHSTITMCVPITGKYSKSYL